MPPATSTAPRLLPGIYNDGVVFKLAPTADGFFYTVIHQFTTDCEPYDAPVMDSAGNFFGTCLYGGNGGGWVYELTNCSQSCTVIDLHDFTYNGRDGASPWGGPTLDADGSLYGTTQSGGPENCNGAAAASCGRSRVWVLRLRSELIEEKAINRMP